MIPIALHLVDILWYKASLVFVRAVTWEGFLIAMARGSERRRSGSSRGVIIEMET